MLYGGTNKNEVRSRVLSLYDTNDDNHCNVISRPYF